MNEAAWLVCQYPGQLAEYLNGQHASARKFRLLSCACCRHIWPLMTFPGSRELVELAEQYAEGTMDLVTLDAAGERLDLVIKPLMRVERTRSDLWAALVSIRAAWTDPRHNHGNAEGTGYVFDDLVTAVVCAETATLVEDRERDILIAEREERVMCLLLRDIFGNPFRPVAFSPEWRTSTAVLHLGWRGVGWTGSERIRRWPHSTRPCAEGSTLGSG